MLLGLHAGVTSSEKLSPKYSLKISCSDHHSLFSFLVPLLILLFTIICNTLNYLCYALLIWFVLLVLIYEVRIQSVYVWLSLFAVQLKLPQHC